VYRIISRFCVSPLMRVDISFAFIFPRNSQPVLFQFVAVPLDPRHSEDAVATARNILFIISPFRSFGGFHKCALWLSCRRCSTSKRGGIWVADRCRAVEISLLFASSLLSNGNCLLQNIRIHPRHNVLKNSGR
jgi:hypothetical protein